MLKIKATVEKFGEKGEKSGWTYIHISNDQANLLNPNTKKSFRVKGTIDNKQISSVALMPMGDGTFILPLNASIRKTIGKTKGQLVQLDIEHDDNPLKPDGDFMECLTDAPKAKSHFETLTPSHRKYFSQWIGTAKTEMTKVKRISQAIEALGLQMGFPEMLRLQKERKSKLL